MGRKTCLLPKLCFDPFKEEEEREKVCGFTCGICMETLSPTKKFRGKKCSHPFCVDCISKYIAAKIEDNDSEMIKCPGMDCNKFLKPLACRSILPADTFVRWCTALCESFVLGFNRAYCPYADCSALVLNECGDGDGVVRKTKCPSCRRLFCFQCKVPWHAGFWCDRSGPMTSMDDVLFEQLMMRRLWRRCPRCEQCVERVDGCHTVKCRCGYFFCYNCGAKLPWYLIFHGCQCRSNVET